MMTSILHNPLSTAMVGAKAATVAVLLVAQAVREVVCMDKVIKDMGSRLTTKTRPLQPILEPSGLSFPPLVAIVLQLEGMVPHMDVPVQPSHQMGPIREQAIMAMHPIRSVHAPSPAIKGTTKGSVQAWVKVAMTTLFVDMEASLRRLADRAPRSGSPVGVRGLLKARAALVQGAIVDIPATRTRECTGNKAPSMALDPVINLEARIKGPPMAHLTVVAFTEAITTAAAIAEDGVRGQVTAIDSHLKWSLSSFCMLSSVHHRQSFDLCFFAQGYRAARTLQKVG